MDEERVDEERVDEERVGEERVGEERLGGWVGGWVSAVCAANVGWVRIGQDEVKMKLR